MAAHDRHRLSRRRFLGAMGASAGAAALNPGGAAAAPGRPRAARGRGFLAPEHFGRIFRLPPFAQQSPKVEAALRELGKPGGLLDANDPLEAGPKQLIVDLSLSANNPNNPNHTAGTTFFGQFLDHDMTFDADSRLGQPTPPQSARNYRTPTLDLDSVYGAGFVAQQELYDPSDHVKLKLESGGPFEDLPRRADGTAIVGDPRNDENLIIAGLHCAFAAFHNRAIDRVRGEGLARRGRRVRSRAPPDDLALPLAHRHTSSCPRSSARTWSIACSAAAGASTRPPGAKRSCPSSSRPAPTGWGTAWSAPPTGPTWPATTGSRSSRFIFDPSPGGQARPRRPPRRRPRAAPVHRLADLLRLRRRPGQAQQAHRHEDLHARCSICPWARSPATTRPRRWRSATCCATSPGSCPPARASPARSASPRSPAPICRSSPTSTSDSSAARRSGTTSSRRPRSLADGLQLGPVGGRIVAEVLIGLLQTDEGSYLATQPRWRPTLPAKSGTFRMTDFLTFAGVDPQSRGQ